MNGKLLSPFDSIRQMAADIILNSTDLLVINTAVVSGALKIYLEDFSHQRAASPLSVPSTSPENELGLCLFFNSVNFCYRDPATGKDYTHLARDGRNLRRTSAFFTALVESGLDWNVISQAASIEPRQWLQITQLDGRNVFYLGVERRERIVGLAQYLQMHGYKTVQDFIAARKYSVEEIIPSLIECGFFKDEFLKRAQVAMKMMDTVLSSRMGCSLTGMDLLTCMADYRIPQVFYNLGAVELSPSLRARLESQQPILSESREEMALRATVIVIARQLSELMTINEAEVDSLLWEYSQQMDKTGRMKIPHMLVATDKY
jgi:hypothetical protein